MNYNNNGHNLNELSNEGKEVVKNINNVSYVYEFAEVDGYDREGPQMDTFHLFVFVGNNLQRLYFIRYKSYIRPQESTDYEAINFDEQVEELFSRLLRDEQIQDEYYEEEDEEQEMDPEFRG
jgi:hypothetical protein